MKNIIRIIAFLLGALLCTAGFWLAGFNFDKRGDILVSWYILSLLCGILGIAIRELTGIGDRRTK